MEFRTNITQADWVESQKGLQSSMLPKPGVWARGFEISMLVLFVFLVHEKRDELHWGIFVLALLLGSGPYLKLLSKQVKVFQAMCPKGPGVLFGEKTIRLTPEGVHELGDRHELRFDWSMVTGLIETPNLRVIVVDSALALGIKKADIPDEGEFLGCIKQHAGNIR
jgi:hypothetical protein